MRFAYADPPYPGQAYRVYGEHEDYAGEVDHAELIARLEREFPDGWALSTSASALQEVLALCPPALKGKHNPKNPGRAKTGTGVRVMAWVKPQHAVFPIGIQYAWEPVILRGGRQQTKKYGGVRDYIVCSPPGYTFRPAPAGHVRGAKPEAFCRWLFDCLGAESGDELVDLFPGSGAVAQSWDAYTSQTRLELDVGPAAAEPLFR